MKVPRRRELSLNREIEKLCNLWAFGRDHRMSAEVRLRQLGPDGMDRIIGVLNRLSDPKRRLTAVVGVVALTVALSWTVCWIMSFLLHERSLGNGFFMSQALMWSILAVVGIRMRRRNYAHVLTIFDDARAVPALVNGLSLSNVEISWSIRDSLRNLLPQVSAEHAAMFSDATLLALVKELSSAGPQYSLVIVSALEAVGTPAIIPKLEELIQQPWGGVLREAEVHDAIVKLIDVLRERGEKERVAGSLLRAAEVPGEGSSVLLRAAADATLGGNEQLVRPVEGME